MGIVSWNTASLLERCLAALPAALGDLDVEIVVVDNASTDESQVVVARHPCVRLHHNRENEGYARAMNVALADSSAPLLIALNPDTEPPPRSLAKLVDFMQSHPDVAVVAPRLSNGDGSLQHSVHRFPSLASAAIMGFVPHVLRQGALGRSWWLEGYARHDQVVDIDWAVGAVHCIRAAALDGAPPYRERWFMYAEDLDLCWRMRQRGWRVVLDGAVVVPHIGNAAGEAAWGSGREVQVMDAVYDWYRSERGPWAVRAWAGVNLTASVAKVGVIRAVGMARPALRPRLEERASMRAGAVSTHGKKLLSGGRPPRVQRTPPSNGSFER